MHKTLIGILFSVWLTLCGADSTFAKNRDPKYQKAVSNALEYLAREQRRQGYWEANGGQYRVAMTALAGNALLAEGSTTTRGKYARNIQNAVDYLLEMSQPNGLIGYKNDYHYTYGHGYSMVFLSQVYEYRQYTYVSFRVYALKTKGLKQLFRQSREIKCRNLRSLLWQETVLAYTDFKTGGFHYYLSRYK